MSQNGISSFRSQFQKAEAETANYNTGGINYLSVNAGFNDFRILPAITPQGSFMYLRHVHKLEVQVTDESGKVELKKKHIFNSRTHGNTPKDIVDEYMNFIETDITEKLTAQGVSADKLKAELKVRMAPIRDWKTGLMPEFKWCAYAIKLEFGKGADQITREISATKGPIDFAFSVGKKIDALAAAFDRRGEVARVDPFSDPNDGGILVINYDKSKDPVDMYQVSLDTSMKRVITPDEIAWLNSQRTLESQYIGSYTRKDFNMAIDGLRRFDEKNRFGAFQNDRFIAIAQEISKYYPQEENVPVRDMNITTSSDPFAYKQPASEQQVVPTSRHSESSDMIGQSNSSILSREGRSDIQHRAEAGAADLGVQGGAQQALNPVEIERKNLLDYIQQNNLPITIHAQHTNDQIKQFIEQELALSEQQKNSSIDNTGKGLPPGAGVQGLF